jgi:hypothetical protein
VTHINAPLVPVGRAGLASLTVNDGSSLRRAAKRFHVSPATASKWAARYRAGQPPWRIALHGRTDPRDDVRGVWREALSRCGSTAGGAHTASATS